MKRFEKLTQLIPELESEETHGSWIVDNEHSGTIGDSKFFPCVDYCMTAHCLVSAVCECVDDNEDLDVNNYRTVLESYGLPDKDAMLNVDISACDARCTLALILAIIRGDRFCEGLLLRYLENGKMLQWLKRLKEIDDSNEGVGMAWLFDRETGSFAYVDPNEEGAVFDTLTTKDTMPAVLEDLQTSDSVVSERIAKLYSRFFSSFYISGMRYWDGALVLESLKTGSTLRLEVENNNPYDANAVAIYSGENKLGFVPRSENSVIAQMLRFGHKDVFECRVLKVDPTEDTWRQLEVGVYVTDKTGRQPSEAADSPISPIQD